MPKPYYAKKKTLAEGLMDVGLMVANASQLKAVLDAGYTHDYYLPLVVLISICLLLQVCVGVLILLLGITEDNEEEDPRSNRINKSVVGVIFIITVLNIFIGGFGISASPKLHVSGSTG
ncbi:Ninjurin-1 [Mizuhopecten yessoensis]|uniref:Ninjurin-1 n=1 Tax=Mizuhopecten yessoensis TaxID=6573 RepID=A0A210PRY8_MIZYE|nr:Ninjurin-1 [Mizuhopecten yessoensis]